MAALARGQSVGLLALFVALGGTSLAVATGSIDSREIKNGTVRGKDVRNSSLTGSDVRDFSLRMKDFARGQVPAGAAGPQGPRGATGTPGSARAYAFVEGGACSPTCTISRSKGITSATRASTGRYCVVAPGLSPATAPALVAPEWTGSNPLFSANWSDDPSCGGGQYRVITMSQSQVSVRNAADTGSTVVADDDVAYNNEIPFVIVIP